MVNPGTLNERGIIVKEGTKGFDKIWVAVIPLLTFGNLVVIGFDAVRFQWSFMPFWLTFLGVFMFVSVTPFALWAMAVNKFFEWTARIQDEKHQYVWHIWSVQVCEASRVHWLNSFNSCLSAGFRFMVGFVLSGLLTIVIIIRTGLEDRMLQKELSGYTEYAKQVKYRLIPHVW
jgi:protein-S-isoprenylcysteine O-methyltransferase Ste14